MPIYEFKCEQCGCVFERLVPVSYVEAPACASCGAAGAKKLFSRFGFASGSRTSFGDGCSTCSSTNCSTCGQ